MAQENILHRCSLVDGFTSFLHKTFLGIPQHTISLKSIWMKTVNAWHEHHHSVTSGQSWSVSHPYSLGFTVRYHTDNAHHKQGNTDSRDG